MSSNNVGHLITKLLASQMSFLSQAYWTTLKTGAKPLPITSTNVYENKWRPIPEYFTMHQQQLEKLRANIL